MKKAYQISFEDLSFYIDEDAREVFFQFLESIEKKFREDELKNEWETFKKSLLERIRKEVSAPNKVISLEILERIIHDICDAFSIEDQKKTGTERRTIVRDMNKSVMGGVCAGIGDFLSIDITLIRVIFIILSFFSGIGIIAYIILWIALPSNASYTKTSNISGGKVKTGTTRRSPEQDNPLYIFFRGIGNFIYAVLKSASSLIGLALILVGVFLLLGFFDLWPWHMFPDISFHHWHVHWPDFFYEVNGNKLILLICIALVIIIPILSIVFNLIKNIFGIEGKDRKLRLSFFILWFLCILAVIGIIVSNEDILDKRNTSTERNSLEPIHSSVIYIDKTSKSFPESDYISHDEKFFKYNYLHRNGQRYLYARPKINIVRSEANDIYTIEIQRYAVSDWNNHSRAAYDIIYNWQQQDSLILLDNYFYARDYHWYNFPMVTVNLTIPKYKDVMFINPDVDFH